MIRRIAAALVLAGLLPLAALAQTPLAAPGNPGWTPAGNDCFVWNRAPAADETASWSGSCANHRATGRGLLVWRSGGQEQRYEGEMRDGHLNGRGKYVFSVGTSYEGDFKNDDFDGSGIMTEPGVRYEGAWKAGRKSGRGVLSTMNGDRYDGDFTDDAMTGRGVLVLSDGRKYEGALKDGIPEGQGTLTDPAGSVTGTWKAGCFNDGKAKVAFGVSPSACP